MINKAVEFENYSLHNRGLDRETLQYSLGALMYTPAISENIADDIYNKKFEGLKSISLCLEDAIADESVKLAETRLLTSLLTISNFIQDKHININEIPLLFVRVRNPLQMEMLCNRLGKSVNILTGFILPKFDLSNAEAYKTAVIKINKNVSNVLYIMPVLESASIISVETRIDTLLGIKNIVDEMRQYVLNIRVGGNDFCNAFGLRRNCGQTIYDIELVKNTLIDILNVFARDYVVSGPVWEYFDNKTSDKWLQGLKRELELDKLNGFIGKTAIHPSQLPVILDAMKVSLEDYNDARSILSWNNNLLGVSKSTSGQRMNESKVHIKWAKKTMILAEIYGVRNDDKN